MKNLSKMTILTYINVLEKIENKENHLLIGNGFNRGLGVNTSYGVIFNKMLENNNKIYEDARAKFEESHFDLEEFIGKLELDIAEDNLFLRKYVKNKIKLDFMQATHEIVKANIKNVYAKKNEGVFLLLNNFTNYFTLNYDLFLYLLLLKYKPIGNSENNVIVFEPTLKFIEDDLDEQQDHIYSEIKEARDNGTLKINFGSGNNALEKDFKKLTKTNFTAAVNEYSKIKEKKWTVKDIDRVVKLIFQEENTNQHLERVDDGSRPRGLFDNQQEFVFENKDTQNLFFLHGAFHIYKDKKKYRKITQETDKALYSKLEDILNHEDQDIVCIFQHENKTDVINNNGYLKNCLDKLGTLTGNLVIIGSALSSNDNHLFDKINKSDIETVYISTLLENIDRMRETANSIFPEKEIYLFDARTISYESPEKVDEIENYNHDKNN